MRLAAQYVLPLAMAVTAFCAPANAQNCTSGTTASGQCVNPGLFDTMQQTNIVLSQPAISSTAYPVLPSGDGTSRYPNQLIPNPLQPSPAGTPRSSSASP